MPKLEDLMDNTKKICYNNTMGKKKSETDKRNLETLPDVPLSRKVWRAVYVGTGTMIANIAITPGDLETRISMGLGAGIFTAGAFFVAGEIIDRHNAKKK